MAKQFRQLDSGLVIPDWMPDTRARRRPFAPKGFRFTVGGGADPGCNCSPCGCCSSGTPTELQVVLTGITNGSCSDCATLNGTYILASTLASDVNCLWQYNLPSAICGFNYVFVQLRNIGGGTPYRIDVAIAGSSLTRYIYWWDTQTDKFDCGNFSDLSVTYRS